MSVKVNGIRFSNSWLNGAETYGIAEVPPPGGPVTPVFPDVRVHTVTETIRVSAEYYEWLKALNRADETMEDALRRLTA